MPEDWSSLIFCVWVEVLVDVVSNRNVKIGFRTINFMILDFICILQSLNFNSSPSNTQISLLTCIQQ